MNPKRKRSSVVLEAKAVLRWSFAKARWLNLACAKPGERLVPSNTFTDFLNYQSSRFAFAPELFKDYGTTSRRS